jgi:hypothetical protein
MGKYHFSGKRTSEVDEAIANELAEANRLKRIEISHNPNYTHAYREQLEKDCEDQA